MSDVSLLDPVRDPDDPGDVALLDPRRDPDDPGLVVRGRGGNRLRPGHAARTATPPRYERVRQFPFDHERRVPPEKRKRKHDDNEPMTMRLRHTIAAQEARDAGELSREEYLVLDALRYYANSQCDNWIIPAQATIGERLRMSARRVREHQRSLRIKGWLQRVHRHPRRLQDGSIQQMSNAYRLDLPDAHRERLHAVEDAAAARGRADARKDRPTPTAPQNRPRQDTPSDDGRSAFYEAAEARRRAEAEQWAAVPATSPDEARKRIAEIRDQARPSMPPERPPP